MDHVTLRSPAELLAAVPYFFGFRPADSLVLLVFHEKQVAYQIRVDLPPADEADDLAKQVAEAVERNCPAAAESGPAVAIIAYGAESEAAAPVEAMYGELGRRGVRVMSVLRVDRGRFWVTPACDDPRCCPPAGRLFDPAATEVAANATFAGLTFHPDRAALAATVEPVAGPGIEPEIAGAVERLGRLSGGQRGLRAAARAAVRQAFERYMDGGRLDDDDVAWLAVLLADDMIRDDTWARIVSGTTVPEHARIWLDVVRRVPLRYVPAPATLLALVAWRTGDGALADIAAARAVTADPTYRLAGLLLHALRNGLPATALDDMSAPPRRRRRAPRLSEAA